MRRAHFISCRSLVKHNIKPETHMKSRLVCYDGELIALGELAPTNVGDLTAVSESSGFLPYLQMCGSSSKLAKEGKIPIGHYALVLSKERFLDLGKEVEVLILDGRAKAMELGDSVITNYDKNSDEFKRIAITSEGDDTGCMYGPEFLVQIPAVNKYASFFLSSATARKEAGSVADRLGKAARLYAHLIKGKKHSWHGILCDALENPTFVIPPIDEIKEQITKFRNPKPSGGTKVKAGESEERPE